jgi:hypothetical protein
MDLEVEQRHCQELQHHIDVVSERRDYFQRYAVEVQTHLHHIAAAATAARDRALDVTRVPEMAPVNEIEQDIAAIAKGLNGGNDPLPGRLRYARIRHIRRLGARRVPASAYG